MPMTDTMPSRLSASINAADKAVMKTNQLSDATYVPSQRQTTYGIESLVHSEKKHPEYTNTNLSFIRSRRGAPSSVTSENILKARASLEKIFMHNRAHIKREFISNTLGDIPDFKNQLDVMA